MANEFACFFAENSLFEKRGIRSNMEWFRFVGKQTRAIKKFLLISFTIFL